MSIRTGRRGGPGKTRLRPSCRRCGGSKGTLGASAATLADALELMSRLDKELSRLYVYASMVSDQDTRVSEPQGMQQEMQQLYASFGGAGGVHRARGAARRDARQVESFLKAEPRLGPYAFYLRDIVRRAPHTLSDPEEKLLADAGPLAGLSRRTSTPSWPTPTSRIRPSRSPSGETAKVDQAGYSALRTSAVRRGPEGGDVRVLRCARRLRPDVRHDDERQRAAVAVLCPRAQVRLEPRGVAERPQHPEVRSTRGWSRA